MVVSGALDVVRGLWFACLLLLAGVGFFARRDFLLADPLIPT